MQPIIEAVVKTVQAHSLTFFLLGFFASLVVVEFVWDLIRNNK